MKAKRFEASVSRNTATGSVHGFDVPVFVVVAAHIETARMSLSQLVDDSAGNSW